MPDDDVQQPMIHQIILDRWSSPKKLNQDLARSFSLTVEEVEDIRNSPAFQGEYEKQLGIYKGGFDDVQLADLKERLRALDNLYRTIPDNRVALKVKVLEQLRKETGPDITVAHAHLHQHQGHISTPPQAGDYEEWLRQNRVMRRAMDADYEVEG